METARTRYLGDLRTEIVHVRSGSLITTDAPVALSLNESVNQNVKLNFK